jgi:hypothetical protein
MRTQSQTHKVWLLFCAFDAPGAAPPGASLAKTYTDGVSSAPHGSNLRWQHFL